MSLPKKVKAVEKIFLEFEKEETRFRKKFALQCKAGCSHCCTKPDIMAYPLEFFPFAWHLHEAGRADEVYVSLVNKKQTLCLLYDPMAPHGLGGCLDYEYRGLICRLFGFSRTTDKNDSSRIFTCRIIKEMYPQHFGPKAPMPGTVPKAPLTAKYYSLLRAIDPDQSTELLPINDAIRKAIEAASIYFLFYTRQKDR
jgi:uncharacterized protein